MHLFYQYDISLGYLSEEESLHAAKVLRLQNGDAIVVLDGLGGFHEAVLTESHPKKAKFSITKSIQHYGQKNYRLHIAIAPTKSIDRLEWFIEKAVEIGIDEISLLQCRFSERKHVNIQRLEKIIIAACKQSMQAYFPILSPLIPFEQFIVNTNSQYAATSKYIAHCYDAEKQPLKSAIQQSNELLILIGPEGDFSQEEIGLAQSHNFLPISLGNSRLRTETAGVMACATVAIVRDTIAGL